MRTRDHSPDDSAEGQWRARETSLPPGDRWPLEVGRLLSDVLDIAAANADSIDDLVMLFTYAMSPEGIAPGSG